MSKHKHTDRLCLSIVALTLVAAVLFMNGEALGMKAAQRVMGYENRLFDTTKVHTLDIAIEDWDGFIETCTNEEYVLCDAVIDGEKYANIGIRAKGNTSLSSVASYGNDRYSFKLEFDQYNSMGSYHGLDKLCLNNVIQDNSYLKDYLTYTMMNNMGAAAPLCSFIWITVNGEDWGLYLAVEAVEDSFLQRNYGRNYGELYKPDSMSMGGGRGNGRDFDINNFIGENGEDGEDSGAGFEMPEDFDFSQMLPEDMELPEDFDPSRMFPGGMGGQMPEDGEMPEDFDPSRVFPGFGGDAEEGTENERRRGGMGGMGNSDVMLTYTDDDPESYPNIFGNAKTDITEADQIRLIQALKNLSSGEDVESTVDAEAVIRYLVVHDFVVNGDSYTGSMVHNYYLYEKDGVLSMIPWDYNLAYGSFNMGGGMASAGASAGMTSPVNSPIDNPVSGGDNSARPMVAWIFASEEYTAMYHQIYAEMIATYFDSGYFTQMMNDVIALISPYVEKEPSAFCTYDEFLKGSAALVEFCTLRAQSVSGQLEGSIPSTQAGQSADNSALIDASHIMSTDMGGMNGMGGNRGGWNANPEQTGGQEQNENTGSADGANRPQMPEGGLGGQRPQNGGRTR